MVTIINGAPCEPMHSRNMDEVAEDKADAGIPVSAAAGIGAMFIRAEPLVFSDGHIGGEPKLDGRNPVIRFIHVELECQCDGQVT